MLLKSWTDSTGGEVISSVGLYPINYGMPLNRTWFSSYSDDFEGRFPAFRAFLTSPEGYNTSFGIEGNSEESIKRILTCLATFLMPREGVDENFEDTVERLKYYIEALSLPALTPKPSPNRIIGSINPVQNRPDLVLSDY